MTDISNFWESVKQQLHENAWLTNQQTQLQIHETDEAVLKAHAFDYLRYLADHFSANQQQQCRSAVAELERVFKDKTGFDCFSRELWKNPIYQTLQFLASYDEEMNRKMEQLAWYNPHFSMVINPESSGKAIYFLYDAVDAPRDFDRHLGRIMPINGGPGHFHRDYHLPIYLKVQEQFPNRKVVLTSKKEDIPNAYIYPLTFNYFKAYIQKHPQHPLPDIRRDVIEDCRAGKAILLLNDLHESADYSGVFSAFAKQLKKQGLIHQTFILSGDTANQAKYAAWLKPGFSLHSLLQVRAPLHFHSFRYFESAVAYVFAKQFPDISFDQRIRYWQQNKSPIKYFLCFNRVVKDFRLTASFLFYKNQLLDKSLISQDAVDKNVAFSFGHDQHHSLLELLRDRDFEDFRRSLPWLVDTQDLNTNHWDTIDLNTVIRSFIWVVTETAFGTDWPETTSFLTEKTYKPIACMMPFIMIGPPGSLRTLRQEGYRTFSQWWDEGYDDIRDPKKRMLKIFELLRNISQWSLEEIQACLKDMRATLEHNADHLQRRHAQQPFILKMIAQYDAIT